MNIILYETGELLTLSIIDPRTGVDWVQDLLGNTGAFADKQFVWSEQDNAYLADRETYEWWAQYIADAERTEQEIEGLVNDLDVSRLIIHERLAEAIADLNDYNQHRQAAVRVLAELREEYADREEEQ